MKMHIYSFTYIIYLKVHEFKVEMTCSGCSGAVERVLGKLGGKELTIQIVLSNCKKFFDTSI